MQDAKTGGSRWVPDIREDEITKFQEQNGDETATYKAVNVHPIISRVLDKLAFFRTHVSAVWYNKLANKTVKDKLDEIDTSISSLNSNSTQIFYYNANTDHNEESQRQAAIKHLMDSYLMKIPSSVIAVVRYAGGFYMSYILTRSEGSINILEINPHDNGVLSIWYCGASSTVPTLIRTI